MIYVLHVSVYINDVSTQNYTYIFIVWNKKKKKQGSGRSYAPSVIYSCKKKDKLFINY